jgi:ribosome-binding factor A
LIRPKTGYKRTERLNGLIRSEIADILATKVKDPRVGFVTITTVDVTQDLRYAKVFVSILESNAPSENKTLDGLKRAAVFIRSELGRRLHIRYIPEITFRLDQTVEKTDRIMKLLDEIRHDQKQ